MVSDITGNSKLVHFMKQDIKHRIYILAISALIFFFTYPVGVVGLLMGTKYTYQEGAADFSERLLSAFSTMYDNSSITFYLMALGFAAALNGFLFLMKQKGADFMSVIPVNRRQVFLAVNLDNIIMIFAPMLALGLLSSVAVSARISSVSPLLIFLKTVAINLAFSMLCYAIFVLAIMLTGNLFSAVAMTVFLNFYIICVSALTVALYQSSFSTFYGDAFWLRDFTFKYLSPFIFVMVSDRDSLGIIPCAIASAAIAGIVLFISHKLYMKREIECAGRAMAFKALEAPLKFLLVIPAGVGGALMGDAIVGRGFLGWSIFGMLCCVIIIHCIIEIIYYADFRKLFSNIIHLAICLAAAALIFFTFKFDLTGYDRFLPAASVIRHAGIYCEKLDKNVEKLNKRFVSGGRFTMSDIFDGDEDGFSVLKLIDGMEVTDEDIIYTIAKSGVANADRTGRYSVPYSGRDNERTYTEVIMSWHMKDGRKIRRRYTVDFAEVKEALERLYDDRAYKLAAYPVLNMKASDVAAANWQDALGVEHFGSLDEAAMAKLLQTYQAEFSSMTSERRRREDPIYCLKFKDEEEEAAVLEVIEQQSYYRSYYAGCGYYPVYPSFAGTIAAMRGCGADLNRCSKAFDRVTVNFGANEPLIASAPGEVSEILSAAVPSLYYSDDFSEKLPNLTVTAVGYVDDSDVKTDENGRVLDPELYGNSNGNAGSVREKSFVFRSAQIPDIVMRHFHVLDIVIYNDSTGWDTVGRKPIDVMW